MSLYNLAKRYTNKVEEKREKKEALAKMLKEKENQKCKEKREQANKNWKSASSDVVRTLTVQFKENNPQPFNVGDIVLPNPYMGNGWNGSVKNLAKPGYHGKIEKIEICTDWLEDYIDNHIKINMLGWEDRSVVYLFNNIMSCDHKLNSFDRALYDRIYWGVKLKGDEGVFNPYYVIPAQYLYLNGSHEEKILSEYLQLNEECNDAYKKANELNEKVKEFQNKYNKII